jgi:ribose transport system substrate-binding protein
LSRKWTVPSVLVVLLAAVGLSTLGLTGALGNNASALKKAQQLTAAAEKGTSVTPDTTKRPVAKGKTVCIASPSEFLESSKIPSDAAAAAAKKIGWKVCNGGKPLDGMNTPATYPGLIRTAIADGANGIVVDALDCDTIKAPLAEAKKKGIVIIPIYAFDCNDQYSHPKSAPLYSGCENYGGRSCLNLGGFTRGYGADQANYIIAKSNNKAKILELTDKEYIVLDYTSAGFDQTIAASGGSKVVQHLDFKSSEVTGDLKQRVQNALLADKSINWVKIPYSAATTFGNIGTAAHALKRNVMGGEGFKDEQDLIKSNVITAANSIDSRWTGWAAIDAMNSVFTHQKTHPSGIGWVIVDKAHDHLNAQGNTNVQFMQAYAKAWGKG